LVKSSNFAMAKQVLKELKFWTPLRLASTVIVLGLVAAFEVIKKNPAVATGPLVTLPRLVLDAENRAASGPPIKLGDHSGKVLLVNLWATWCGPCRSEIPELVKLHKEYQDRGVEMIGLSTEDPDASAQSVADFVRAYNVDYQIGWATREVALTLMQGRTSIPQSFIIARDGRIVKRFIGFHPQSTPPQIKQALEEALVEKS
jgi:thiol-disulfide isomerase/thioredoxin